MESFHSIRKAHLLLLKVGIVMVVFTILPTCLGPCDVTNFICVIVFFNSSTAPWGLGRLIVRGFTITHFRHTTFGRTPLDEWPARRTDLYLTTHNTHKGQTSMPSAGFKPTIPVSDRPQTYGLDRTTTGIGMCRYQIKTFCTVWYLKFLNGYNNEIFILSKYSSINSFLVFSLMTLALCRVRTRIFI
jgi:hypothetical protein